MNTDTIRTNLNEQGFSVIECDDDGNGLFMVTVRAVKWSHPTRLSKCAKAGLALERYGNLRGIDYMAVRVVMEKLV